MTAISLVRPATPDDAPELWRMFRAHHEENALFPLSEPKVQFYLDRVLYPERLSSDDQGPRGIIGVIGKVGSLEGVIMLIIGSPWYSDVITMDDCMNYVDANHRKSDHAKTLIAYAKHVVDHIRKGHPDFKMVLGIVSTIRTAAKIRLYEKQMGPPVGAYFMFPRPAEFLSIKNTHLANRPSAIRGAG